MTIFHVTHADAWHAAQLAGQYVASSLQTEGFIHFSTDRQLQRTLNYRYRGRTGLIVLIVDETRLVAPLQFDERIAPDDTLDHFPHLYGPLNLDAVRDIFAVQPDDDGLFSLG